LLLRRFRTAISVEEGSVAGGLGSLAAETIAQNGLNCRLCARGVTELFTGATGGVEYMRAQHGLDALSLVALAESLGQRSVAA
jgi:transketolase